MDIKTTRLRDTKPGETIATELGAILKTAIRVDSVYCYVDPYDPDFRYRGASGVIVQANGYSSIGIGNQVRVCIGAP